MKFVILAAGTSKYFPLFFNKPKCLYHFDKEIQIERLIKSIKCFVPENDIIVLGGYKYKILQKYIKEKHPDIEFRINYKYNGPAINSLKVAAEKVCDDIVFILSDENISINNIKKICSSNREMSLLVHNKYYYYSLGIFKLRKDVLRLLFDKCYESMEYMKKVYCYANKKNEYDGTFAINSGICLGYITIDLVRRIGKIDEIKDPIKTYKGQDIDFIYYDVKNEYIPDIDTIFDTDECKNNFLLKIYSKIYFKILSFVK